MDHRLAPANHALQQLRVAQHEAQHGLQHKRAPRPLPLFLELVREAAREEPELARRALAGLARYGDAERMAGLAARPVVARIGGTCLRDLGGSGSPVVLVPSLINPPNVLDLPGASLAEALAARHRVLLLDWGAAAERAGLDLGGHVAGLLVPLVEGLGEEVSLVGYCLGGTMALAAAKLVPVCKVMTLAAPWRFAAYPQESREGLELLWRRSAPAAEALGVLPIEVLQAAFWSFDPRGIVAKFARLADEPEDSIALRRFVTLEDWANDGEPLPLPAARELIEELFLADRSGGGTWRVGGVVVRPDAAPSLHFTARADRIVPATSAPPGAVHAVSAGHVGMVVGSHAPSQLHAPLLAFLTSG